MLYQAPRIGLAAVLLFSLVMPAFAAGATEQVSQDEFFEKYLAGEDVSQFAERMSSEHNDSLSRARTTAPASLAQAYRSFLPQLSRALESDHTSIWLLKPAYEQLKAEHLLFSAYLNDVGSTLGGLGVSRARFSDRYYDLVGPLFEGLDSFYEEYENIGSSSVAENISSMFSNYFDVRNVNSVSAELSQLIRPPHRPIIRASGLPYDSLNLAAVSPATEPLIEPSYRQDPSPEPQDADLMANTQAPLSDRILKLAGELNYDPAAVFQYVRNNISREWYAGAMKGAEGVLDQGAGNSVDQASLLVALLRASSVPARYVHGVVELPMEQLEAELGVTDPANVVKAIRAAGIPVKSVVRGGRIAAVEVEHTWVSAYVPYTNYRGATVDRSGKLWLPLDPSQKIYSREPATAVLGAMVTNVPKWIDAYFQEVQSREPLETVQAEVEQYLSRAGAGDYRSQLGDVAIEEESLRYLPNSLKTPVIAVTGEEAVLSDSRLQKLRFRLFSSTESVSEVVLDTTVPLSSVASQRVTLSYLPATSDDHNIVNGFGGLDSVPPYLVKLRAQIKVDGKPISVSSQGVDMAKWQRFEVTAITPTHTETVQKQVLSGGYEAIGVSAQRVVNTEDKGAIGDTEYLAARLLSQAALRYIKAWDESEKELAQLSGLALIRPLPAIVFVGQNLSVDRVLDEPQLINWKGVTMDAALRIAEAIPQSGASLDSIQFFQLSGLQGSFLEHARFEEDFNVQSISADKGLALASVQGLEIATLSEGDVDSVGNLSHTDAVKDDVRQWLELGYQVTLPTTEIVYEDWQGAAWVVTNPLNGSQGYFLSGGIAGGQSASVAWPEALRNALDAEYSELAETNVELVRQIVKIPATDFQEGKAGEDGQPFGVMALTIDGRPVAGAEVTFKRDMGGLTFEEEATEVTVETDSTGIAAVTFTHGTDTSVNSIFLRSDPSLPFSHKVSYNSVVAESYGVKLREPFTAYTGAGPIADLVLKGSGLNSLPGKWVDTLQAIPVDKYGNHISNADVTFSALPPSRPLMQGSLNAAVAGENIGSCPIIPNVWNCGVASHTGKSSSGFGAVTYLFNGTESGVTYGWRISSGPIEKFIHNTVGTVGSSVHLSHTYTAASDGSLAAAAKLGETYAGYLNFSMKRYVSTGSFEVDGQTEYQYEEVPVEFDGPPSFTATDGAQVYNLTSAGPGLYRAKMMVGPTPGLYSAQVSGTVSGNESVGGSIGRVYGIDPKVTSHAPEEGFKIDAGLLTKETLSVTHDVAPERYTNPGRRIYIYADGEPVFNTTKESAHLARLPAGLPIDLDKEYTAKLVFYRGSDLEIASDPYPIPIFQRTIAYPEEGSVVTVAREVDLMNQWVCDSNTDFVFALNHPATVTIDLTNRVSGIETNLADEADFAAGVHELDIPTSNLSEGIYEYRIATVSSLDQHPEEVTGYVIVQFNLESNLPIGHAVEENVDLFDGHLFLSRTDFSVQGRGPDLEFTRSYSSNNRSSGTLGAGWSHSLDSQVRDAGCGSVAITGGVGGGRYFPDGLGRYRPEKGRHGHLKKLADGSGWVYTAKDGTKYHYEEFSFSQSAWQLGYVEGTNGNILALGYDPAGIEPLLTVVRDEAGRTLEFEYVPKSGELSVVNKKVISRIKAPYGLEYEFQYDSQGRLTKVTKKGADGTEVSESYGYNAPSMLGAEFQRFNDLNFLTDANGNRTDYVYEIQPILSSRVDADAPNVRISMVKTITHQQSDASNEVINFTYSPRDTRIGELTAQVDRGSDRLKDYTLNQYGAPVSIASPAGTVTMKWTPDDVLMTARTDERGITTNYVHDEWGNVTQEQTGNLPGISRTYATISNTRIRNRIASETGRNGETTRYEYDGRGNLVEILHPEGYRESFTYAGNGDRLTHKDRNGNLTSFQSYDSYGYLTSVANAIYCCDKTSWNELGLKTSTTNGRGATTQFTYDDLGRLIESEDAEGGIRSFTYDDNGNKLTEVDQEGRTTRWEYNQRDQVTLVEKTTATGVISRKQEYDQFGNLVRESDWLPEGDTHWTRYEYDGANRQTDIYREDGEGNERHTHKEYDGVGNVIREEQDLGRFKRFEYDALNRLVRVYDAYDELTREIVHDDRGKTRTEYDKLRRRVITHLDGLGRPTRIEQPLASGKNKVTERTYDGNGNVITEINPVGRRTESKYDELNRKVEEAIVGAGDKVLTRTYQSFDDAGNLILRVNGRGVATVFKYDLLNRQTRKEFPKDSGQVYTYAYDKVGNRTEENWPNGNIVTMVYDDLNRLDTRSDRLGLIEDNDYDANGNVIRRVDANGNVTTTEYNGLNEPRVRHLPENRKEVQTYDLVGNLKTNSRQTEGGGRASTTTYTYDLLNRKETETDQLGQTATYAYDDVGNLVEVINRRNHKTTHTYNELNQRTSTTDPNGDSLAFTYDLVGNLIKEEDKKGHVTHKAYDRLDRVTRVERNDILIKLNEYDEVGNLVTETDANGNITVQVYDAANRLIELSREESSLTRYAYDRMGNRTAECDPESRPTNWRYDFRGRQVFEINALGETTTFNHDGNGNRIAQTKPKGNGTESVSCGYRETVAASYPGDSADYTSHYGYDGADRLTSVTDGNGETTRYTYNYLDLRTGHTDALEQPTTMAYDDLGRLTQVAYADGAQEQYTAYDGNGNLTAMTDANGNRVSYVYDKLDRETVRSFTPATPLASEVVGVATAYDKNGNVVTITETDNVGDTRVTNQGYDSFDRLIRREDSFGKVTGYAYDNNGNRTRLIDPDQNVTRYTFDGLNRVKTVTNLQGTTTYTYDKSGRRLTVEYPSNAAMNYGYDAVGRTKSITHTQNNAQVTAYRYEYDTHGNRDRQEEENGRGLEVTTYAYDNLDRLTQVSYPDVPVGTGTTVLYNYDAAYNRTGETTLNVAATTIADKTYRYNSRNQLTGIDDNLAPAENVTYDFDANGNQTGKTKGAVTTDFIYDVRDNLRSVTAGGSTVGQFLYDYRGMRIEKDGARGIERYSYDDQSVLTQFDESGATLAKYEYGGRRLISLNSLDNGIQFYHFDALGSPVTLTRPDGSVQARYSYDAWGHKRHRSGTSWNRFGFTGHEEDRETGLIYAKARYYDPDTGRFLSQDPWEGDTSIAPSLNKYLYGYMNPTLYVDLDGRTSQQFHTLMTAAIESYRRSGNRTALGVAGELHLERLLKASGEIVIKGPETQPGQHNADIVSFNPESGQVSFFDNKIQTQKSTVSRANNLALDVGRERSISEALTKLESMDLDHSVRRQIQRALNDVAEDPSRAVWAVANATPDELAEVNNKVQRVSGRLADRGVRLANVLGDNIELLSPSDSVSNGRKVATKLGKAIPIAGTAVSATVASGRLLAAEREDEVYRQAMMELGIHSSGFDHHSVQRELAVISGEEAGGEGGATGGMSAVLPVSPGCGFAAPLCVLAGGVAGGLAGDTIGGMIAEYSFDKAAESNLPAEIEQVKERIMELREQEPRVIVEDPAGQGGH